MRNVVGLKKAGDPAAAQAVPEAVRPATSVAVERGIEAPWEVRVWWRAGDGVTCPEFTVFDAEDEDRAIDEAVSVMDGCRHRRALTKAVRAEIRRTGLDGVWRTVGAGRIRSYL